MRYLIEYESLMEFPEPVREHHVELRLVPRSDEYQQLLTCSLGTVPEARPSSYRDYFGNRVDYFCAIAPHTLLTVSLRAEVATTRDNHFDFTPVAPADQQEWLRSALRNTPWLNDFILHRSTATPPAQKLAETVASPLPRFDREATAMNNLLALMQWIPTVLRYRQGGTGGHADLLEAVRQGYGTCQDIAHLFITVARSWGVPARYVMGYRDPGVARHDKKLVTHAWAEALVPGGGWIGFDAAHDLLANDHYVAVAVGRDVSDALPQRTSFKGDTVADKSAVTVTVKEQKKRRRQTSQ